MRSDATASFYGSLVNIHGALVSLLGWENES